MSTNAPVEEKAAAPARRTFHLRSIRTRLLVIFVLLVLLPAVIIGIVSAVGSLQSGQQQAINQLESVATLKQGEIDNWVRGLQLDLSVEPTREQDAQRLVTLVRAAPDTADYQAAYTALVSHFQQAIELRKNFEELFVMDSKGRVVLSTDATQVGKSYDKQGFFTNGLKGDYVQPPFYATSLGRMSVIVAQPVEDEQGYAVGVLAGRANIARLSEIMTQRNGLGTTGETYLVGSNSALLTEVLSGEKIGYVHTQGSAGAIESRDKGSGAYDNYQGVPVLGVYHWLPDLQIALLAEQAQSEAFGTTYMTIGIVVGIAALAVLAAVVIGFVVTRGIANPLANLAETSTKIAGGDLTARAQAITSADEIGVLATSFNAMADRVDTLLTGLAERSRELEAGQRVAVAASERVSPDDLLDLVVNLVRDQFNLYHVQVYIVDEKQAAAVLRQSTGFAGRQLLQKGHKIPLDRPALVTQAIRDSQPVLVDDVTQTAGFLPNPLLPDTKSELVVPLKVGDRVIGVLDAQDRTPGRFGQSTVALFQTMANQISFLFENSQLLERTTAQTEALNLFTNQLRTAADIAHRLGAILDPERLLQQVVELMQSRFGLYHAHIYVLDEATGELVIRAGSGEVGRVLRERGHSIALDAEKSLVARAARDRETVLVNDTTLESDFMPNPLLPQTRSEVALPLVVGDKVLGVLDVQDDQAGRFTPAELDTFATLTGQIATSLQNAGLFEEQKRTEAALQASVARFEGFAGATQYGFGMADLEGNIVYANAGLSQMLGESSPGAMAGKPIPAYYPPEMQQKLATEVLPILMQSGRWKGELELQSIDGRRIPVEENYFVIRGKDGQPRYIADILTDITERKQAEQSLAQSVSLLQATLESTADGILVVSSDGKVSSFSRRFTDMWRIPEDVIAARSDEQLLGFVLEQLVDPNEFISKVKELYDQPEAESSDALHFKDGRIFERYSRPQRIEDKVVGRVWSFRDVTEQRRAEEAVRESQQMLQLVMNNIPQSIFWKDRNLTYLGCNRNFANDTGLATPEEVIGQNDYDMPWVDQAELYRADDSRVMDSGEPVLGYEEPQTTPDGSQIWLRTSKVPLRDAAGNVTAVLGMYEDITDRKRAEAERERFTTQLGTAADVASQVSAILDPDQLLNAVIPLLHDRFRLYHVHFYGLDAAAGELVLRAGYGEAGRIMLERGHKIPLAREQSLVARAARTKEAVLVNDVTAAPDFLPNPLLPETRSEMAVPAIASGQVLGVFDVQQNASNYFTETDLDVFTTLTAQIATALQNAGYVEMVEARLQVSQALAGAQTEDEVLDAMIKVVGFYPQAQVSIYTFDLRASELTAVARRIDNFESGQIVIVQPGMAFPGSMFPVLNFISADTPFASANMATDERVDPASRELIRQTGGVSMAALPITAGNEWLGLIAATSGQEGYFDVRKLYLYQSLAEQGATALHIARLHDQVQESLTETKVRFEVSQALAGARTEDEVLDVLIRQVGLSPKAMAMVFTNETFEGEPVVVARRIEPFDSGQVSALPLGTRLPASLFKMFDQYSVNGEFVSPNMDLDERLDPISRQMAQQMGTVSMAIIPLNWGTEQLGSFSFTSKEEGYFDEQKLRLYRSLAEQGTVALHTARLRDQVQESLIETRVRFEVSQALAGAQTEEEVLDAIIQHAGIYPGARVTINLIDPSAAELTTVLSRAEAFDSGLVAAIPLGTRFTAKHLPLLKYISPDAVFASPNISLDERVDPQSRELTRQQGGVSMAIVPITTGNEWLGVITATSKTEGYFDEDKLHLYQTLADQGGVALHTARLYDETQRTSERLKEVDRLKSEFLANMSHELRTPLNSILGYTEVMLMGIDGEMDPETQADVQAIYDNGQHLLHLISDILDLAKIEAGRLNLNFETVNVRPLIDEIVTSTNGLLLKQQKPVKFNVEVAEDLPAVQVDRLRLNQILNNLLSNAVKFTDEGHITLRAVGDDGHICFEVEDTGIGINSADQERIFDQFRQADGSYKRRAEGTGLGLSITRYLIQMHGGTIAVHSQPGQGSTFTVRLPLKRQAAEQGAEAAAPSTGKGKGKGKAK